MRRTPAFVLAACLGLAAPGAHAQNGLRDPAASTGQTGGDLGRPIGLRHKHVRPESLKKPGIVAGDSILSSPGGAGGNAAGAGTMTGAGAVHGGGGLRMR
jgi:hypothetical protein